MGRNNRKRPSEDDPPASTIKVRETRVKAYRENLDSTRTYGTARVLRDVLNDHIVLVDDFRDDDGDPMTTENDETIFLCANLPDISRSE